MASAQATTSGNTTTKNTANKRGGDNNYTIPLFPSYPSEKAPRSLQEAIPKRENAPADCRGVFQNGNSFLQTAGAFSRTGMASCRLHGHFPELEWLPADCMGIFQNGNCFLQTAWAFSRSGMASCRLQENKQDLKSNVSGDSEIRSRWNVSEELFLLVRA